MERKALRVLIVDDSATAREMLAAVLQSDPELKVIGAVDDGEKAVEAARRLKPDIITMDLNMPNMNGLDATRRIMAAHPVPIVIVSGTFPDETAANFQALEAGALAMVRRPAGPADPDFAEVTAELVKLLKLMAEVRVVRRWNRRSAPSADMSRTGSSAVRGRQGVRVVAIGASTGGPAVLRTIFSRLPKFPSVPVLVVQHISTGFIQGLTEWLTQSTGLSITVAEHREIALPGRVYFAPDGMHMGIDQHLRVALSDEPPEHGLRPSVSFLFRSVAAAFGSDAAGVLLTGMGSDGADALKVMRDCGSITMVQNEASSVVFGMPGEAIKRGAALRVLGPEAIGDELATIMRTEEKAR